MQALWHIAGLVGSLSPDRQRIGEGLIRDAGKQLRKDGVPAKVRREEEMRDEKCGAMNGWEARVNSAAHSFPPLPCPCSLFAHVTLFLRLLAFCFPCLTIPPPRALAAAPRRRPSRPHRRPRPRHVT